MAAHKNEKQYYIKLNDALIPVSHEVYVWHNRWIANQRHYARRDGKCSHANYHFCDGECKDCPWWQDGFKMLPLRKVFGHTGELETADFDSTSPAMDEIVADRIHLEKLYRRLNSIVPDGALVFRLRALHYTEREITDVLGNCSQSTVHYRIQKMDEYMRKHRDKFEEFLR